MAKSVNQIVLLGRLTKDIEMHSTTSGKSIGQFSLAVDRYGDDGADFFDVVAWEKTAELMQQYTQKGSKVLIMGRLGQDTWDDKETGKKRSKVTITANDVTFLDSKSDSGFDNPAHAQQDSFNRRQTDAAVKNIDDKPIDLSSIPF